MFCGLVEGVGCLGLLPPRIESNTQFQPTIQPTYRGEKNGFSMEMRRAESFNVLVAAQIGYFITCRFLKRTTLHYRVFLGNWVAYVSIAVTVGIMVRRRRLLTGRSVRWV